ncbi:hypothetical protein PHMEG_00038731, partial [Phytophthora megakarya]
MADTMTVDPVTPAPTAAPLEWPENMTTTEGVIIAVLPFAALVLCYVMLRLVWRVPTPLPVRAPVPSYGTSGEQLQPITTIKTSLVEEGEVAGDYEEHWYNTFDFAFLVGMAVYAGVMLVLTFIFEPQWLGDIRFWLVQLPKLVVMMTVSLLGGIVCRCFCDVDEKGYIMTNKS